MEMITGSDKTNEIIPQIIEEDVFTVSDYLVNIGDMVKEIVIERATSLKSSTGVDKSITYLSRSHMFRVENSIYVYTCKITDWRTLKSHTLSNIDEYYSYTLEEFFKMYQLNDSDINKFMDIANAMLSLADHSIEYTYKLIRSLNNYGSKQFIGIGSKEFNEKSIELLGDSFKNERNNSIYFALLNNLNSYRVKELLKMAKVTEIMDDHIYDAINLETTNSHEFKNVVNAMVILKMSMKSVKDLSELTCNFDNSLKFRIYKNYEGHHLKITNGEHSCIDSISFSFNPESYEDIEHALEAYARYHLVVSDMEIETSQSLYKYGIYVVKCKYGNILGKQYSFFKDYAYDYVRPSILKIISDDLMNLISIELKD